MICKGRKFDIFIGWKGWDIVFFQPVATFVPQLKVFATIVLRSTTALSLLKIAWLSLITFPV